MSNLCQYKNMLGEPRKGVHSIRIFDFAIVDILLTVILAVIITAFISAFVIVSGQDMTVTVITTSVTFMCVLLALFILGIFLHWLFCVETKLNGLLGL